MTNQTNRRNRILTISAALMRMLLFISGSLVSKTYPGLSLIAVIIGLIAIEIGVAKLKDQKGDHYRG